MSRRTRCPRLERRRASLYPYEKASIKFSTTAPARKIYGDAKLSPTYSQWQRSAVLEARIRDVPDNVAAFSAPVDATYHGDKQFMVATAFTCMACHRQ